jgi:Porin PorA
MRRGLGVTLTGLGAFFIVLAVLFRFYLPGQVIKFPLNEYSVNTVIGHNMSYLSSSTGTEVTGATVRATSTVEGDVASGSSSTAVWNQVVVTFDITTSDHPGVLLGYDKNREAFNRRTGVLQNCCGTYFDSKNVHVSGQSFLFPLNTQKQNYQVFNTTTLKAETARYLGTTTVSGESVYKFTEVINNQQIGSQTLPGSLVNIKQTSVTLPEFVTANDTYYVDPVTGVPVKVVEDDKITLANPSTGATALVLEAGTLTSTQTSINSSIRTVNSAHLEISAIQTIGPLVAGLLGLVLLIFGILAVLSADETEDYYEDEDEAVGVA